MIDRIDPHGHGGSSEEEWGSCDEGERSLSQSEIRDAALAVGRPRSLEEIAEMYSEFREKVWWNRHQNWLHELASGKVILKEGEHKILQTANGEAKRIEAKYGLENLGWDDFEWGLLSGRMSALSWAMDGEWAGSLAI